MMLSGHNTTSLGNSRLSKLHLVLNIVSPSPPATASPALALMLLSNDKLLPLAGMYGDLSEFLVFLGTCGSYSSWMMIQDSTCDIC